MFYPINHRLLSTSLCQCRLILYCYRYKPYFIKAAYTHACTRHISFGCNVDIQQENGDVLTRKGDFLLVSDHVLEIVTKLFLLYQNQLGTSPAVHITTQ